ncbi:DinB family protein [Bacillus sp. FJAT-49736]|uniref:DinB family protein n=1 Tax=Bacillus sp. FJAT-49736 TaxID=2833582 RepID=UPI001BC9BE71|nr:DinB family protein [Bacillus sp. FJAT-49736]MBS4172738.1 DinB family protein [Bacillus sp. FJAT-49736]
MMKQFQLTRQMLLKFLNNVDEKTADVQPKGFNNTIHWHIGHVLVSAEAYMFGYPKMSTNLPASYNQLFAMGSKPADWSGEIPSVTELIQLLEEQSSRIQALTDDFFEKKLPVKVPYGNIETFGDLFIFLNYHEADHLGQMKAMKKLV